MRRCLLILLLLVATVAALAEYRRSNLIAETSGAETADADDTETVTVSTVDYRGAGNAPVGYWIKASVVQATSSGDASY